MNVPTLGSDEGTTQNSVGTQEHPCRHTGPGSTATRGGVQRGLPNSTLPVHPTATKFRCHFTSDSSNPPTLQPQLCLSWAMRPAENPELPGFSPLSASNPGATHLRAPFRLRPARVSLRGSFISPWRSESTILLLSVLTVSYNLVESAGEKNVQFFPLPL